MNRRQVKLTVVVDLDPVPGVFSTAESAEKSVQTILDCAIGHYNPKVTLQPPEPNHDHRLGYHDCSL